ncbi:hypothetical protein Pla8534_58490 [Lignipirellula cremea]|uniref:Uncharacterized protein n=1 Tax=Lignipirellula cremea TaxID=2528010 RepID=A0A518E1M5_9BACT|nr:hypothetical protein Pla8534_58490 [Lignipirellula cremea]
MIKRQRDCVAMLSIVRFGVVKAPRKLFGIAKNRFCRCVIGFASRVVDQLPQAIMLGLNVVHDRVG